MASSLAFEAAMKVLPRLPEMSSLESTPVSFTWIDKIRLVRRDGMIRPPSESAAFHKPTSMDSVAKIEGKAFIRLGILMWLVA